MGAPAGAQDSGEEGAGDDVLWRSPEVELDDPEAGAFIDNEFVTVEGGHLAVVCEDSDAPLCQPGTEEREIAESRAETVGRTLMEIRDWFEEIGLPPSFLAIEDEDSTRSVSYLRGVPECGTHQTLACARGSSVLNRELYVRETAVTDQTPNEMRSTLAHEWFHTATAASPAWSSMPPEAIAYLHEAMAEAVGQAFAWRDEPLWDPPPRNLLLDLTFLTDPAGAEQRKRSGYEKAPYIRYAGRQLGSEGQVGYLDAYMHELDDDGEDGMTYLYGEQDSTELTDEPFDELFPRFVAELNQPSSDRNGQEGNDYYVSPGEVDWPLGSVDAPEPRELEAPVAPHAALALLVDPITAEPGDREPRDRLAIAEIEIEDADGDVQVDEHLHLVFEHDVVEGGSHRWLMRMDEENEGPFLRIVNAAPSPGETEERSVLVNGSMNPLTFQLPGCVPTGDRLDIQTSGASLEEVENFELRASPGRVEAMTLIAPSSPGEMEVELVVHSPITRSTTGSIQRERRPDETVDLGTVDVVEETCMVRMHVVDAPVRVTYTTRGDYTEYVATEEGGQRMYAAENDIAVYVPSQGGWIPMPPGAGQMMQGMLGQMQLGAAVPGADVTRAGLHDLPIRMPEHLGWDVIQRREAELLDEGATFEPVPCPLEGEGCTAVETAEGRLVYDEHHRLVELRVEEGVVRWEYGAFEIDRPPGW